jgi:hypothetical protein
MSRKFSLDEVNFDDADQDEQTIYRGLAVPVDIRQVTEVSREHVDNVPSRSFHRVRCPTASISIMKHGQTLFVHIRARTPTGTGHNREAIQTTRSVPSARTCRSYSH